jgi:hypothetical protein
MLRVINRLYYVIKIKNYEKGIILLICTINIAPG